MKKKSFTTHWDEGNIKIEYTDSFCLNRNLKYFFNKWIYKENKKCFKKISISFGNLSNKKKIETPFFKYSRKIGKDEISTEVANIKIGRASIRSIYKLFYSNRSVVGLSELYLSIFRTAIFEPIEFLLVEDGWFLQNASAFILNGKTIVVAGKSKSGKSTLIKELISNGNVTILADNYCFIKGHKVKTIMEPIRSGRPSRLKRSYYGKSVAGWPSLYEGKLDEILIIERGGGMNKIEVISKDEARELLEKINIESKEGIQFLDKKDILKKEYRINLEDIPCKKLYISEGLQNIRHTIKLLSKL